MKNRASRIVLGLGNAVVAFWLAVWAAGAGAASATAPLVRTIDAGGMVDTLALSSDGKTLAAATARDPRTPAKSVGRDIEGIGLWNPITGRLVKRIPIDRDVLELAFSPDGRMLAGETQMTKKSPSSYDVRVWDVGTGKLVRLLQLSESPSSLAFSPDGSVLVVGGCVERDAGGQRVFLYDTRTWKPLGALKGFQWGGVWHVAVSRSNAVVAAATRSCEGSYGGDLMVWDARTGRTLRSFTDTPMAMGNSGQSFYFTDGDATLVCGQYRLDLRNSRSKLVAAFRAGKLYCLGPYSDGDGRHALYARGWEFRETELRDLVSGQMIRRWASPVLSTDPCAAFSARTRILAGTSDLSRETARKISLWSLQYP